MFSASVINKVHCFRVFKSVENVPVKLEDAQVEREVAQVDFTEITSYASRNFLKLGF